MKNNAHPLPKITMKIITFLDKYLFDITYLCAFSLDREVHDNLYNGEYLDYDKEFVSNIYKDKIYADELWCLDVDLIVKKLPFADTKDFSEIKEGKIYSVYCDFKESHQMLIVKNQGKVYTFNLYGGWGRTVTKINDEKDFDSYWNTFIQSSTMKQDKVNDKIVNENFQCITGIRGYHAPYYLRNLEITELDFNDMNVDSVISKIINVLVEEVYPFFENRDEKDDVLGLIEKLKEF